MRIDLNEFETTFVTLNERGIDVEEEDNPFAVMYFDDNGGDPDGNFDENISGEWLMIDGKIEVPENIIYAYRTIDDTTLINVESYKENGFRLQDGFLGYGLVDIEDFEVPNSRCEKASKETCFNCGWARGIWPDGGCQYTTNA